MRWGIDSRIMSVILIWIEFDTCLPTDTLFVVRLLVGALLQLVTDNYILEKHLPPKRYKLQSSDTENYFIPGFYRGRQTMDTVYTMLFNLTTGFFYRIVNVRDYFSNQDCYLGSKTTPMNNDGNSEQEIFYSLLNGSIGSVDNLSL